MHKRKRSTKQDKARMASQEECPISLEKFEPSSVVFRHMGVVFMAQSLYDYVATCPFASNPVNRLPITDGDVRKLNALVHGDLPTGEHRSVEAKTVKERDEMSSYMEEEARGILSDFMHVWLYADQQEFFEAYESCENRLLAIKVDTLRLKDGGDKWNFIVTGLRQMVHPTVLVKQRMIYEAHDLTVTHHMLDALLSTDIMDETDGTDSADEEEEGAIRESRIPPPYPMPRYEGIVLAPVYTQDGTPVYSRDAPAYSMNNTHGSPHALIHAGVGNDQGGV